MPSLMAKVSTALRTLPTEVTAMVMAVTAWLLVAAEVPRSLVSAKVRWALLRTTTTEMAHRRTLRVHVAAKVLGALLRTVATELSVLWALGAHVTAKVRWALLRTTTAEMAHRRTLRAHVAAEILGTLLRTVATELSLLRALLAHVTAEVLRSVVGTVLRTTIPAVVALRAGMPRSLLMVGIPASHVAVLLMALPVRLTVRLEMVLLPLVLRPRRLMLRTLRWTGRRRRVFPVRLTG
jgi:hypothetical protein